MATSPRSRASHLAVLAALIAAVGFAVYQTVGADSSPPDTSPASRLRSFDARSGPPEDLDVYRAWLTEAAGSCTNPGEDLVLALERDYQRLHADTVARIYRPSTALDLLKALDEQAGSGKTAAQDCIRVLDAYTSQHGG